MNNYNPPCCAAAKRPGSTVQSRRLRPDTDTDCGCTKGSFPQNTAYAMAYIPFQQSGELYACDRALARGTAFPCLDLPFIKGCCK